MTDEPRTTYYATGAVRQLFAAHKTPAQGATVLPDVTRTLTAHETRVAQLVPRSRRVSSRTRLAIPAFVLAVTAAAFLIGRMTAQSSAVPGRPSASRTADAASAPPSPAVPQTPLLPEEPASAAGGSSDKASNESNNVSNNAPASSQVPLNLDVTPGAAVEALATGDYPQALHLYRALAAARPHEEVFATIASRLARKLDEHCANTSSPGDPSCAAP
jgi:hypothetical protein